jgi:beta-galactosidase/beta-glucuronidase
MMLNDENHPSIVFWANGNEGGHNRELDHLFPEEDIQKRPVIHPWEVFGGFETTHYREFNYGIGNYDHGHNILMPTEFLHGMFDGGHGAGIEDYWNAMWNNPLSAGGFLWDLPIREWYVPIKTANWIPTGIMAQMELWGHTMKKKVVFIPLKKSGARYL